MHSWQAQCVNAEANTVTADVDWGDNLEGTSLKSGTPIRVEVGLTDDTVTDMVGYHVIKLQPSLSDKLVRLRHGSHIVDRRSHPDQFPIHLRHDKWGDWVARDRYRLRPGV